MVTEGTLLHATIQGPRFLSSRGSAIPPTRILSSFSFFLLHFLVMDSCEGVMKFYGFYLSLNVSIV